MTAPGGVRFQCLAREPGAVTDPAELDGAAWAEAAEIGTPGTVGDAGAGLPGSPDDYDWWLRAEVVGERVRFEGLTVPCTVYVDGREAAQARSMFLPLEVDLGEPGVHEVVLHAGSVTAWLRGRRPRGRWRTTLVGQQGLRWLRTTLVGRAPAFGPGPAPVGPWRPVAVDRAVLPPVTVRFDGSVAADGADLRVIDPDGRVCATGRDRVRVIGPRPWWPRGYGRPGAAPAVYRVEVAVGGRVAGTVTVGFRDVDLRWNGDRPELRVNGVPVFCRGAVWIPRADGADDLAALDRLASAGATMVRIPGGTLPASTAFADRCAELGLLLWHDAMIANVDPPRDLDRVVADEMTAILDRIGHSPALAVVCGGGEVHQQAEMFGVPAGERRLPLLEDVLPEVCASHPARAVYVPGSPSGRRGSVLRPDEGFSHWFGVGGYLRPLSDPAVARVAFATECLAFAIPSDGALPGEPDFVPARDRGATWDFQDVTDRYVAEVFGVDPAQVRRSDPERYAELCRCAVTEAMLAAYRYWRRADSGCAGALVLAATDRHPHAGWGLIDAAGRAKAPLAALGRVWAPLALTVTDGGPSGVAIDLANDTAETARGRVELRATVAPGTEVAAGELDVEIPAHGRLRLYDSDVTGVFADLVHAYAFGAPVADAVDVRLVGADGAVLARDCLVVIPRPGARAGVTATVEAGPEPAVTVVADTPLRYVHLRFPGYRPADDRFHLAPGVPYRVALFPEEGAAPVLNGTGPNGTVRSIDAGVTARATAPQPLPTAPDATRQESR